MTDPMTPERLAEIEALAAGWDECAEEALACGWLHEYAYGDMVGRNPYRKPKEDQS